MKELVSIVIPVYNMEKSLRKCVESVRNQDYPNIEIIIVDDGSTDSTFVECQRLMEVDSRIKAFHTNNQGSGPARNFGIEKANGHYIYFPDADDYIEPNAITILVNAMNGGEYDLVVFGFSRVTTRGIKLLDKRYEEAVQDANIIRMNYSEYFLTMNKWGIQGAPWNKFFDLNVIKFNSIKYPALRRHQDDGFIGRYMCFAKKVHFITDVLYTYYVNDLKKEWEKYPTDYIDAVTGLYEVRNETIMQWNRDDHATHDFIQVEYISNFIKAIELGFSPKMKFSRKERLAWQIEVIEKYRLNSIHMPKNLGIYQKMILSLIMKRWYQIMYILLHFKVSIQNTRLFDPIKKVVNK